MISPFAPLYPWLLSAVMFDAPMCVRPNGRARLVSIQRTRADGPTQYKFAEHRPTWTNETPDLDLRHGPTRYAVLRVLHELDEERRRRNPNDKSPDLSRPWALGAPWSLLTDEQAGRATAAILRAVGEDPSKPAGVVPDRILSEWFTPEDGDKPPQHYRHGGALAWREVVIGSDHSGRYVCICQNAWIVDLPWDGETPYTGPETGDAGRLAADNAARALGCLMIEDLTPT